MFQLNKSSSGIVLNVMFCAYCIHVSKYPSNYVLCRRDMEWIYNVVSVDSTLTRLDDDCTGEKN